MMYVRYLTFCCRQTVLQLLHLLRENLTMMTTQLIDVRSLLETDRQMLPI